MKNNMKRLVGLSFVLTLCFLKPQVFLAQSFNSNSYVNNSSGLTFNSDDSELNEVYFWAKKQALAYAFEGDAVGLWYEAALPGREAFCMRDVSHQAMGAHFIGLAAHTKNMLRTFAKNVTDARDWCSLWEITRHGTPALQDYLNDEEFWYNLPANFDILDCCFRMYNLTGDQAYLTDSLFINFYKRTVYDYVERWEIGIDKIMHRERFINSAKENVRRFRISRGIPGYDEGDMGYIASLDLLVNQQVAFESYANMMLLRGDDKEAATFFKKADKVSDFINTIWWNKKEQQYFTYLDKNRELKQRGVASSLLYYDAAKDTLKYKKTFEGFVDHLPKQPTNGIEGLSHLPEILYRNEEPEKAREILRFILKCDRKEYPEGSFGSIGAMVEGLMGIEMEAYPIRSAVETGRFLEQAFVTKSRLTAQTKWAEMKHIPLKRNDISVRHEGKTKTIFTNNSGPQLQWKACFAGVFKTIQVNGKISEGKMESLLMNGENVTWFKTIVGSGETITVEVFK